MQLYRVHKTYHSRHVGAKDRVCWFYAANAVAAKRAMLALERGKERHAVPRFYVEPLGPCTWAEPGLVFDSSVGFVQAGPL